MATYKGREVQILEEVEPDHKVRIQTEGGIEVVRQSEITIFDEKELPEKHEDPVIHYARPTEAEIKALEETRKAKRQAAKDKADQDRLAAPMDRKDASKVAKQEEAKAKEEAAKAEAAKVEADKKAKAEADKVEADRLAAEKKAQEEAAAKAKVNG